MTNDELIEIRSALGLTQSEMAEEIGISRTYLGLLERNNRPISKKIGNAALAVKPKSSQIARSSDPIVRGIEQSLIKQGIQYETQFDSGGQIFDIFVSQLSLGIVIDRDQTTNFRPTRAIRNVLIARGGECGQLLAAFIEGGQLRRSSLAQPASLTRLESKFS